jgi:hypothetical protein
MKPATPIAESASSPSPASVPVGHQCLDGSPILMKKTGKVRIAITAPPYASARIGWRLSVRAHFSQICGAWYQVSRRASQRGRSISRPRMASRAGRRVIESITATATTMSPPIPTLRVSISGVSSSAPNPTNTVSPEVITARPAVARVLTAAICRRAPRASSSRNRVTTRSE